MFAVGKTVALPEGGCAFPTPLSIEPLAAQLAFQLKTEELPGSIVGGAAKSEQLELIGVPQIPPLQVVPE